MRTSPDKLSRALTIILTCCVVFLTAVVARREFLSGELPPGGESAVAVSPDVWRELVSGANQISAARGRVQLVEFADFECPACARFADGVLAELRRRFPEDLGVLFAHLPLTQIHRLAYPAARAAECAGAQGRFLPFHDLLYSQQDRLGLKPFEEFAAEAAVADLSAFRACARDTAPVSAVDRGLAVAERLGIRSTPTVILNGQLLRGPLRMARLDSLIRAEIVMSDQAPPSSRDAP